MENPPDFGLEAQKIGVGTARNSSGIWSLEGDRLSSVEDFDEGPAAVLVRTEHVLVLTVDLPPLKNVAKLRAALPFAVEDRIAEPLEDVHVALGAEVSPGRWLAGVVRHDLMRQWVMRLEELGLERAALVPDALALPTPGADSWAVDVAGTRAMVRVADATGFAMPAALLEQAWQAAGEPACLAYGDPLPARLAGPTTELEIAPLAARLLAPALDLRQGRYARPRRKVDPLWKRVATVAAIGALAHGAIAAADTLALDHIASQRDGEVRALAQTLQPGLTLQGDLAAALPETDGAAKPPSRFLTLLSRAGGALAGAQGIAWRSLAFDGGSGALSLEVEAADIAGLQQVAQKLEAAGLVVQPGAASTDQGRAIGSFAIRAR